MNRNIPAFCAAMLAFALLLVFCGGLWAQSGAFSLAEEESVIKTVYLTFDDGPSDRVTPKILDVLAEEDVKATFFIVGKHAETRKALLKREAKEGHTVAVHSYTHVYNQIYASPESLLADIEKCNDLIEEVTGSRSTLYRFPGGSFNLSYRLISAVTSHGMRYVDWNASFRDAEIYNATPYQLYQAAVTTAASAENIVFLAHDSTTKTATAEALREIIRHFKNEGYLFKAF
ncbi:MAG: polysaccharide deacetylase [Clostridia bacterium]|nr:polysaccharide deacetylase [Clostridia bacterium]